MPNILPDYEPEPNLQPVPPVPKVPGQPSGPQGSERSVPADFDYGFPRETASPAAASAVTTPPPFQAISPASVGISAGSKVKYVPGMDHALNRGADGSYPWVVGMDFRKHPGKPPDIRELSIRDTDQALMEIRRSANPTQAKERLRLLRPAQLWDATVKAVNEDGTLALDIVSNQTGVTLHYDHVPLASVSNQPHSAVPAD